jgi:hypothetical protein
VVNLQFTSPWNLCTPLVYRYLQAKYVDDFFEDGSLRLSSAERFGQHPDEVRNDPDEGKANFFHRTEEGGGQTIAAHIEQGQNAYILCGSAYFSPDLMDAFGADSYIRINDSTAFGQAVSRHIPGFSGGAEGHCRYQSARAFERDLGFVDGINVTLPDGSPGYDQQRLLQVLNQGVGVVPIFLKGVHFAWQAEYRLVWFSSGLASPYLEIKVPEARELCTKGNDFQIENVEPAST